MSVSQGSSNDKDGLCAVTIGCYSAEVTEDMTSGSDRAVELLRELGRRPAVPFFEQGPAEYIFGVLSRLGLDPARDAWGNVVARYRNLPPGAGQPPIAFVAHMDHPGFEIVDTGREPAVAKALGGVPSASLTQATRVLALASDARRIPAETVPLDGGGSRRETGVRLPPGVSLEPPVPVVFDLPDFVLDDDMLRMRALDDLAGCAAILAATERLIHEDAEVDVFAVFTRAEEVGLYGARLMAGAQTLPRETLVVSIESSPVIPGVAQGAGPVIRTGDAAFTFDADAEQVLATAAERIGSRDPGYRSQRQLMSGGVCEATAFAVFGYRATGIAFPLGNYHNGTSGLRDPEGGVDAEYIRLSDFLGGVELVYEAARSVGTRGDSPTRRRMVEVPDEVRARLSGSRPDGAGEPPSLRQAQDRL